MEQIIDQKIAQQLKALRVEHNLSLAQLSQKTAISRASLSRLENAEVSPTTHVLGKLCSHYGITMSRLMSMVEAEFEPHINVKDLDVWKDSETGFIRKMISPPSDALTAEMIECHIPKNQTITYAKPPKQGLEHHLYMLDGALEITIDGNNYTLKQGDCLRYQLHGQSQFKTPKTHSATYILTIV